MTEKTISDYLVLDWKNETYRTRKSKPSAADPGPNEPAPKEALGDA